MSSLIGMRPLATRRAPVLRRLVANGAAQLFTAAKMQHLNLLPQGQSERWDRAVNMVETMETYFGSCTNHRECEAACPKGISIDFIALMNKDYAKAQFKQRRLVGQTFP